MKFVIISLFIFLSLSACQKEDLSLIHSQGVLVGPDLRTCATCGGLIITIKNDPTPNPPASYRLNSEKSVPFNLDNSLKYPINVDLIWKHDTSYSWSDIIIVRYIKAI